MSRSVYVGNIPYEATEQQLTDVFKMVGKVYSFNLMHDKNTGKPKGYGFCEYGDAATAQSAVENLENHPFQGRTLRVSLANQDKNTRSASDSAGGGWVGSGSGQPLAPKVWGVDDVKSLVQSLPREQLVQLLTDMKSFIQTDRAAAKQLLESCPQLAQMMLQVQIAFGLVRVEDMQLLYKKQASQQTSAPQPVRPAAGYAPQPQTQYAPPRQINRAPYSMGAAPGPGVAPGPAYVGRVRPAPPARGYPPATKRQRLEVNGADAAKLAKQNAKLQKVLALSEAAIAGMPPAVQEKIRRIRKMHGKH